MNDRRQLTGAAPSLWHSEAKPNTEDRDRCRARTFGLPAGHWAVRPIRRERLRVPNVSRNFN